MFAWGLALKNYHIFVNKVFNTTVFANSFFVFKKRVTDVDIALIAAELKSCVGSQYTHLITLLKEDRIDEANVVLQMATKPTEPAVSLYAKIITFCYDSCVNSYTYIVNHPGEIVVFAVGVFVVCGFFGYLFRKVFRKIDDLDTESAAVVRELSTQVKDIDSLKNFNTILTRKIDGVLVDQGTLNSSIDQLLVGTVEIIKFLVDKLKRSDDSGNAIKEHMSAMLEVIIAILDNQQPALTALLFILDGELDFLKQSNAESIAFLKRLYVSQK